MTNVNSNIKFKLQTQFYFILFLINKNWLQIWMSMSNSSSEYHFRKKCMKVLIITESKLKAIFYIKHKKLIISAYFLYSSYFWGKSADIISSTSHVGMAVKPKSHNVSVTRFLLII